MNDANSSPTPSSPDSEPLASVTPIGVFADLAQILHGVDGESLSQVLQRIAAAAFDVVPELDEVSVTLMEGDRPKTVVFTGSLASYLDERQYELGFGPCLDAAVSGSTITVDTADPTTAYPDFAQIAASRGITHVLSVGMPIPQRTVGALNMYSATNHAITPDSVALAQAFAGYAGFAVANAALYHSAVEEAQHMHTALRTRAVIEQAKGILMGTRRCTAEEAFTLLTRASQNQNRKLRDIAIEIVTKAAAPGR